MRAPRLALLDDAPDAQARRRARLGLLVVAVAFGVAQVWLIDVGRPPNWDEIVYVSQTAIGEPAVFYDVHRARGMALLTAPVAVFDPPFVVIRAWMVLVGTAGVFAAFAPWTRRIGAAAPVAAGAFAFNWVALYFGSEIYPNFTTAVAVAAATGLLATYLVEGRPRALLGAAAWLAVAALIRPSDAVLLGVGALLATLVLAPRRLPRAVLVLAAGGLAGIAPWFVEGFVRFGRGPVQLFLSSQERGVGGAKPNQLPLYLRNLEGPLRCVDECRDAFLADPVWALPPGGTVALLVVAGGLALVGLLYRPRSSTARSVHAATLVVIPLIVFYAKFGAVNLRYVLPVAALLALPAARGAVLTWTASAALPARMVPRVSGPALARVAMLAVVLVAVTWQGQMASDEMERGVRSRERARILGTVLAQRADGRPCAAATQHSYPQIQYWSPCVTVDLWSRERNGWLQAPYGRPSSHHDLRALAEEGYQIYVLSRPIGMPDSSPAHDWDVERLTPELVHNYRLWTRQPDQPLPPSPRIPSDDPAG